VKLIFWRLLYNWACLQRIFNNWQNYNLIFKLCDEFSQFSEFHCSLYWIVMVNQYGELKMRMCNFFWTTLSFIYRISIYASMHNIYLCKEFTQYCSGAICGICFFCADRGFLCNYVKLILFMKILKFFEGFFDLDFHPFDLWSFVCFWVFSVFLCLIMTFHYFCYFSLIITHSHSKIALLIPVLLNFMVLLTLTAYNSTMVPLDLRSL